jgi:cytochrome c-type biogenesis protein CcmH/NrfG
VTGVIVAAIIVGVPALAFTLWPLFRRGGARTFLALPPDEREQLTEAKAAALKALRELEFEHGAGHLSDDDFVELRARYEAEAARVLVALDQLAPRPGRAPAAPAAATGAAGWRHPVAASVAGVLLVAFGVALGVGIVRYTAPDTAAMSPMPGGSRMSSAPTADAPMMGQATIGAARPTAGEREITPEILQGMLGAAREALAAGRYQEAIMAYEAILKRQPKNTDALTHLGLILAMAARGDQADVMLRHALDFFGRALAVDPGYAPALLYRGNALYQQQQFAEAVSSWEKFLAVAPPGEERQQVTRMIAQAKAQAGKPAK